MPIYQQAEKNAESLLSTEYHNQDDSAYGKHVIHFRNNKNTTSASKKDTPSKTKNVRSFIWKETKTSKIRKPEKGTDTFQSRTLSATDQTPHIFHQYRLSYDAESGIIQ